MRTAGIAAGLLAAAVACSSGARDGARSGANDAEAPTSRDAAARDARREGSASDADLVGARFFARMAGLWTGQVSQTVLGGYPVFFMDVRPASGNVLFGRTDVDAKNSLRFAFSLETFDGKETLIFRNGGYFMGILRDTRTALVDADEASGGYHFCAEQGGCAVVDAKFTFSGDTSLVLDVHVMGRPHMFWDAVRQAARPLPTPFPETPESQGDGTAPFPPLPILTINVPFNQTLAAPAAVWAVLSTSACTPAASACELSRTLVTQAAAGDGAAKLTFQEILPGRYYATVVLVPGTAATQLALASGDGVSVPNQIVTVLESGITSASLPIVGTVP